MKEPTTFTPSLSASALPELQPTGSALLTAERQRSRGTPLAMYAVTVFFSAFLLFQVQPVIAKIILPWFGGSAAVWTTCMLFFQLVLLLGYLYSHALIRYLRPRTQT